MSISVEPRLDFDPDEVHDWLLSLEEGLPSDRSWKIHERDPVEELYRSLDVSAKQDLSSWLGVSMMLCLVTMGIVVMVGIGKCTKWFYRKDDSAGGNYEEAIDLQSMLQCYQRPRTITASTTMVEDKPTYDEGRLRSSSELSKSSTTSRGGFRSLTPLHKRLNKRKISSQSQTFRDIQAFQERPLPPLSDSDTLKTNIFTPNSELKDSQRAWLRVGEHNHADGFNKVSEVLLGNSLDNLCAMAQHWQPKIRRGFPPKNKFACSEIIKLKNRPKARTDEEEGGGDVRMRSMSMDDECMSYNSHNRLKSKKLRRVESHDSFQHNVTINKIYANMRHVAQPPVGTYGTIEKYGYLELPTTSDNPPPLSSSSRLTSSEESVETVKNMGEGGRCLSIVSEERNSYGSPKLKHPTPPAINDGNIYDSVKGVPGVLKNNVIVVNEYDTPKTTTAGRNDDVDNKMPSTVLTSNPYDSVKCVPTDHKRFPHLIFSQTTATTTTTTTATTIEHTYAKILDSPQSPPKGTSDIRNRPIPVPSSGGEGVGTFIPSSGSSSEQGSSLPRYEKIANVATRSKGRGAKKAKKGKGEGRGIYMKFGEVLTTKL